MNCSSHLFLTIVISLLFIPFTFSQTPWGGIIQSDETLTAAGSPYIIDQNTLIMENVTLTIEPGTVLRFRDSMRMQVNGTIRAIGTVSDSIVFTRAAGSTSGWGGLHFHHLSEPYDSITDGGCKLSYVQIKHTISAVVSNSPTYVLRINGASPLIEHSEISCFEGEISIWQAGATLRDCSVHDCKTAFDISDPTFTRFCLLERCHIHDIYSGFNAPQTRNVILYGNVLLKDCVLEETDNEIAVAIYSNQVKLRNNVIRNGEIGVALLGGWQPNIELTGNRFSGNRVNLLLSACQRMPLIAGNDFMDYQTHSVEVTQYHYPFLNEDCMPIDSYYTMNVQGNYWGTTNISDIETSIHDFYDDFLQQVIVDYDNFAVTPFNTANQIAASLPDNIHCLDDMGIEDKNTVAVEVWPNPTQNNQFQLKANVHGPIDLTITDLSGRIVFSETVQTASPDQTLSVKMDDFLKGCFLIRITDSEGKIGVQRITLL